MLIIPYISCSKCKKWVAQGGSRTCPARGHIATDGQPIQHCLEHCANYTAYECLPTMSPYEHADCIKASNLCPVHLSTPHNYDACTKK